MNITLEQIEYCAQACHEEKSGELSVADMINAYSFLMDKEIGNHERYLTRGLLLMLKGIIEPEKSPRFVDNVGLMIFALLDRQHDYETDQLFMYFMKIAPFASANYRVGSLLWNYLSGTLEHPKTVPETLVS